MNENPLNAPDELANLLSDLTDGKLGDDGRARLRQLMADDPAAFDLYCKWMHLDAMLYLDLQHPRDAMLMPPLTPGSLLERPPHNRRLLSPAARRVGDGPDGCRSDRDRGVAGLCAGRDAGGGRVGRACCEACGTGLSRGRASGRVSSHRRRRRRGVSRAWRDAQLGAQPLVVGSPLPAGQFVVDSGLVQLEFLSGANVVVEGPADLELVSTRLVVCRSGKLRASCAGSGPGLRDRHAASPGR